jgi:hypothetical protein
MQMQMESSDRYNYSKTHKSYVSGCIGRIMPATAIPVVAGDTLEIAANVGLQMTPMLHELVLDFHYTVTGFFVQHRKVWTDEDTTPWTEFIGEGMIEDSAAAGSGTTLSQHTYTQPNFYLPNCRVPGAGASHSKAWLYGYNAICDGWYRDFNYEDALGLDHEEATTVGQRYGRAAMQLPNYMNTGLKSSRYDARDYSAILPDGSGNIDLIDIGKVQAEYKTQISRDFWDRRYRDWMKGSWGSTGISYDVDDLPEMLFHEEGFMSGTNIMGTDDASLGDARGASATTVPIYMPPKYFAEHGMLWIMILIRMPTVYADQAHYLAIHDWDYRNSLGDPRVVVAQPPHELDIDDFRSGNTSNGASTGFHPYAQWYRTHPDVVHEDFHNVAGMPFITYEDIVTGGNYTADERLRKANILDWGTQTPNLFQTTSFKHWQSWTKFHVECKSHVPSATTSAYAGAN